MSLAHVLPSLFQYYLLLSLKGRLENRDISPVLTAFCKHDDFETKTDVLIGVMITIIFPSGHNVL